MSTSDTSSTTPNADLYATFPEVARILQSGPPHERVSVHKIYALVKQGRIPVYRLPDRKPAFVKVDEVRGILAKLSAQGKIRRGYGSFGPDAVVRDLSKVAGQHFRTLG